MIYLLYQATDNELRIVYTESLDIHDVGLLISNIAPVKPLFLPEACTILKVTKEMIPQDESFREAWKLGDINEPIKIDFEKAISIHRQRLQEACERKIEQLETELEIAIIKSNLPAQVAIRKTQEILRTLHQMDMTHCKTIDDIKYCVPKELYDVWGYYALPSKERSSL